MKHLLLFALLLPACEKSVVTKTSPVEPSPVVVVKPDSTPANTPPKVIIIIPVRPKPSPGWIQVQADRWQRATVRPEKVHFTQSIANQIKRGRSRYETVSRSTGVPWQVIGCIHNLEGSLDFRTNLGQGDPLTAQSRHVPRGRPPVPPNPPFSWEYAAEDAIRYDHLDREAWNPIGQELQNIEAWNGTGYQKFHPEIPSPYLWSWTSISRPGKYISDGKWSSTAVSQQCGASAILKALQ